MICLQCNTETTNPKFCSRSCAAIYTNTNGPPKRKRSNVCTQCKVFTLARSYKHRLCQTHWEAYLATTADARLNKTLAEFYEKASIKGKHASWKHSHVRVHARSLHKQLAKSPCAKCGYDKHVELAHIKEVSSFPETATLREVNGAENIVQLCPNCHWEFDNLPRDKFWDKS